MAEITVNLIHDLKMKHAAQHKPPFFGGLRTGYLRAWLFVVFKVFLIVSLLQGGGIMMKLQEDVALLDQYVRDDFPIVEYDFAVMPTLPSDRPHQQIPKVILASSLEPRGPAALPSDEQFASQPTNQTGIVAGVETP